MLTFIASSAVLMSVPPLWECFTLCFLKSVLLSAATGQLENRLQGVVKLCSKICRHTLKQTPWPQQSQVPEKKSPINPDWSEPPSLVVPVCVVTGRTGRRIKVQQCRANRVCIVVYSCGSQGCKRHYGTVYFAFNDCCLIYLFCIRVSITASCKSKGPPEDSGYLEPQKPLSIKQEVFHWKTNHYRAFFTF